MSKFTIKVELQSLKIEVEGTRDDAPRLAARVGAQLGELITPALLLENGNGNASSASAQDSEKAKARGGKRRSGTGASKTPADDINISVDPSKYGSPAQTWTAVHKAIWFLYVLSKTTDTKQLTGYSIAKNFNKSFRSAGAIVGGNVSKGLDKERLKGTDATVGADTSSGAAKYFLTNKGELLAQRLIKGEAVAAE
jgi:hypothetical protein